MKTSAIFKYIFNSAAYGALLAVVLLILVPEIRSPNSSFLSLFSPAQQETKPLSYARAVSVAGPAVVNIYSNDINNRLGRQTKTTKLGSGVIMAENGFILTNFHVVQNAEQIMVLLQSGQQFPAELIGFDQVTDLAVLKVNANNLPVIPQNPNMTPFVGDVVLAIGNPLNLGQTVTQGIISGTGRNGLSTTSYLEFLQMDAAINKGNSGGALVNTNGELVAINSRNFTSSTLDIQGIFFAVPYQLAVKVMREIIENGRVIRGWLGISSSLYIGNFRGFIIDAITPGSPAHVAGIEIGDIVYMINDIQINSITQALDIIAETAPGTQLDFKLYRNQQPVTLPIIIGEFKG